MFYTSCQKNCTTTSPDEESIEKMDRIKVYKSLLINIICLIEIFNEKYDPVALRLKDWSKQIALNIDDYTEILENLYEKYKNAPIIISPEMKLIYKLLLSATINHLSQTLFEKNIR